MANVPRCNAIFATFAVKDCPIQFVLTKRLCSKCSLLVSSKGAGKKSAKFFGTNTCWVAATMCKGFEQSLP